MPPLYAHLLGDEGFGIIELMTTVAAFMVPILLQGQGCAFLRLSFDHAAETKPRPESTIIWYLIGCACVAATVLLLVGELSGLRPARKCKLALR